VAVGVEAPRVDAPAAAVLVVARPGDDETTVSRHRHRRVKLVVIRGDVDAELTAQRVAARVVAPRVDAPAALAIVAPLAVPAGGAAILTLAGPRHHEITLAVHPHGPRAAGGGLLLARGGVDQELRVLDDGLPTAAAQ